MEQQEATERANRWRLEQVVHICEQRLQQMVREIFDQQQKGSGVAWRKGKGITRAYPDLERSLALHQRGLARTGKVASWDAPLCNRALQHMRAFKKDKAKSSAAEAVRVARNLCAHAVGGRVTVVEFEDHYPRVSEAYEVLGGDIAVLQQIRDRVADVSDANITALLTRNEEAVKTATNLKIEGNRLFNAKDFQKAKCAYAKGIQLGGVIDTLLLAQLYNNRAATNLHMEDLESAKQDAKRASELAPQWAKPYLRLAEVYHKMFEHVKAADRLEVALGLAQAAQDTSLEREIKRKMAEYRLLRTWRDATRN